MYRHIEFLLIVVLLAGCAPKTITPEQKSKEEKAIGALVTQFWKSYGSKNWAEMNKLFTASGDFVCFGTDSSRATQAPWQASGYEKAFTPAVPGEFANFTIQFLDGAGELASVFCELKVEMTMGGKLYHAVARYAAVTKKENGEWHILRSMASFPNAPLLIEQKPIQM
jgi:hypothetical protein